MIFGRDSEPDLAVSRARAFRRSRLWLSEALDVVERRRRTIVGVTLLGIVAGLVVSWVAPDVLPAEATVGAGVALIALAIAVAVATALDAVDPHVVGPRHVRSCGGDLVALLPFMVDERDADELAEAIIDLQRHLGPLRIGLAPAGADPATAVHWSRAIALSIARTGTSVLHLDLASPTRGRPGAAEIAEGLVDVSDVADLRPDLRLASIGPGEDATAALDGIVGLVEAVPGDVEVVLISLPSVASRTVVNAASALHQVLLVAERSLTKRIDLIAAIDVLAAVGRPPQVALVDGVTYARVRPGRAVAPALPVTTRPGALEKRLFGRTGGTAVEDTVEVDDAPVVLDPTVADAPTDRIDPVGLEPRGAPPEPPRIPEERQRPPWLRQQRARSRFDRFFLEPSTGEEPPSLEAPLPATEAPLLEDLTGLDTAAPATDALALDDASPVVEPPVVEPPVVEPPVVEPPVVEPAAHHDVPAAAEPVPAPEAPSVEGPATARVVFDDVVGDVHVVVGPADVVPPVEDVTAPVDEAVTPLVEDVAGPVDVVPPVEDATVVEAAVVPEVVADPEAASDLVPVPTPETLEDRSSGAPGIIRFDALDDPLPELDDEPTVVVVPEPEPEPEPVASVEPEPEPEPEPVASVEPEPEPEPEPVALVEPEPEPEPEPVVLREVVARPADPALSEDALGAAALAFLEAHAPVIDGSTIDVSPAAQRQAVGLDGGPEPIDGEATSPAPLLLDDDVTTQLRRPESEWPSWASVEDEEDLLTTTARMAALRDQLEQRDED
jgi:hypothetical protein